MTSPLPSSDASSRSLTTVPCPQCNQPVEWSEASPFRPFCSRRCRLIDLGDWIDERNSIPGEPVDWMDDDEGDPTA
ncbi:MAG: DNA gyrase inhibitor YacG [Spiribacter sp.]|nr:DNA gyrase inhibitor YacG [Spiribacter sp.]MDR9489450.1 DNA gyrase inhibitor YacG [Spiribacter sp.]